MLSGLGKILCVVYKLLMFIWYFGLAGSGGDSRSQEKTVNLSLRGSSPLIEATSWPWHFFFDFLHEVYL